MREEGREEGKKERSGRVLSGCMPASVGLPVHKKGDVPIKVRIDHNVEKKKSKYHVLGH